MLPRSVWNNPDILVHVLNFQPETTQGCRGDFDRRKKIIGDGALARGFPVLNWTVSVVTLPFPRIYAPAAAGFAVANKADCWLELTIKSTVAILSSLLLFTSGVHAADGDFPTPHP